MNEEPNNMSILYSAPNNVGQSKSKQAFILRKQGKIFEATEIAYESVKENPNDEWNYKALFWCLDSVIKSLLAQDNYNKDEINAYFSDYKITYEKINKDEPVLRAFIKVLQENYKFEDANQELKNAKEKNLDPDIDTNLGWNYYKWNKYLLNNLSNNLNLIKRNLFNYSKLSKVEKPSILNSLILHQAFKLSEAKKMLLTKFLPWWGNSFQKEDYDEYTGENGQKSKSFFDKVVKQLGSEIKDLNDKNDINFTVSFLEKAQNKSRNEWLPYYLSKAYYKLGEFDKSINLLNDILKNKASEFWVWSQIGDIFMHQDLQKACSFYSRSLLCKSKPEKTINVRQSMAQCLVGLGELSYAKDVIEDIITFRRENQQKIPYELQELINQQWYKSTTAQSFGEQLQARAQFADDYLSDLMPLLPPAIVGRSFKNKEGKEYIPVFIKDCNGFTKYISRDLKLLSEFNVGDEIAIKGNSKDGKINITSAQKSSTNNSIPLCKAVITGINKETNRCHWFASRKLNGLMTNDKDLYIGDFVELKAINYLDHKGINGVEILNLVKIKEQDIYGACFFDENLEVTKADNLFFLTSHKEGVDTSFNSKSIFCPANLASQIGILSKGDRISGLVAVSYDKSKNKYGYKLIKGTKR